MCHYIQPNFSTKMTLVMVVLFGLAFRIYLLVNSQFVLYSDDAIYASLARFFYEGNFEQAVHPTWPPLYPLASAMFFGLIGNWEQALRTVSALSGSLIPIPVYYLSKKLTTHKTALIIAIVTSSTVPFLKYSLMPYSDMLAVFLLLSGVATFLNGKLSLSSFSFGLAYLTRSEGLMFFYLSLFFLLVARISFKKIAIFAIVFFLTVSPYALIMRKNFGRWSLSHKATAQIKQGHSFELRNGSTWSQEVASVKSPNYGSIYFSGAAGHVLEYSDWYWFLFRQRASRWKSVLLENVSVWTLPLIGVGAIFSLKRNKFETIYILSILGFGTAATIFATPISDIRYLMWTVPLSFVFMIYIFKRRFWLLGLLILIVLPIVSISLLSNPTSFAKDLEKSNALTEIKKAGKWIKRNSNIPNPKIMARHEGFEFYAEGETVYIPQDLDKKAVIKYGKENGANYLIAWQNELESDLEFPLDRSFETKVDGRTIVIYAF